MKKDISKGKNKGIKWMIPELRNLGKTVRTTSGECGPGSVPLPAFPCIPGTDAAPSACIGGSVGN